MPQPRRAVMVSVDPTTMRGKVAYQPDDLLATSGQRALSGWLPILSLSLGSGWGILAAPMPGAQVVVIPIDGFSEAGAILGAQWSAVQMPPSGYTVGEFWLQHETGAFIKLRNDGSVWQQDQAGALVKTDGTGIAFLQDASGVSMTFMNNGMDVKVVGRLWVSDDIVFGPNQIGIIDHEHGGITPGTADTGPPVPGTPIS